MAIRISSARYQQYLEERSLLRIASYFGGLMNIIADVAGEYETLQALLKKLPLGPLVFVGDMIDRGPASDKVVDFAMKHTAIMGNHEHMMLEFCGRVPKMYDPSCWLRNGGVATIEAYQGKIREDHLDWLETLPVLIETDELLITHSSCDSKPESIFDPLWSRQEPGDTGKLHVFGHNSQWGLRYFRRQDGSPYAVCLDQSRKRILTAMHWPSMEIFEQEYV